MWFAVDKPLLRVGRSGVQRSHLQSLGELLAAHTLVKVQVNSHNADVLTVGRELADGSGGYPTQQDPPPPSSLSQLGSAHLD